jgi:pSer/pThr/pTyr-binding forkhead associated (FHA) protein
VVPLPERNVFLKGLTPEAKNALGGNGLKITHFPFRLGRESRIHDVLSEGQISQRHEDSQPNNDLYLVEPGAILNVSREHCLIDEREGRYLLIDRGSACGTIVEGEQVGERRKGGWILLNDQDVIIVGSSESRFVFKFVAVSE